MEMPTGEMARPMPGAWWMTGGMQATRNYNWKLIESKEHGLHDSCKSEFGLGHYWWCQCKCGMLHGSAEDFLKHVGYYKKESWRFECEICEQPFKFLGSLKSHMRAEHGIKEPLKEYVKGCVICGEKFEKAKWYWQHCATVHNLKRKTRKETTVEKNE